METLSRGASLTKRAPRYPVVMLADMAELGETVNHATPDQDFGTHQAGEGATRVCQ